ncbi:hypothetical protein J2T36_002142 [Kerstersia gyiorum]|nr:hypothetical protein [Kerstersia gyiorum]
MLPPPAVMAGRYADVPPARPDDWSGLAIPAMPVTVASDGLADMPSSDNGGPRRQPELSESVAYDPEPEHSASDLSLLDDDGPLPLPSQLDPAMQRTARLASLNPNDGIDL